MVKQPDGTYTCPICGRTTRTALFAKLHDATFHEPVADEYTVAFRQLVAAGQPKHADTERKRREMGRGE